MDLSEHIFHATPAVSNLGNSRWIIGVSPMIPYTPENLSEVNEEYKRRQIEYREMRQQLSSQTWHVASSKDPNKKYEVEQHVDGSWTCSCKGFQFRKHCSHIEKIQGENK